MRRPLLISGLVTILVPFLLNGATATGGPHLPTFLKPISGTVSVDPLSTSTAGARAQVRSAGGAAAPAAGSGR